MSPMVLVRQKGILVFLIEIETNDPTIKALIKRINRMEEQIHELGFRIDRLESNESKPKPN
jgi:hypothetical protein